MTRPRMYAGTIPLDVARNRRRNYGLRWFGAGFLCAAGIALVVVAWWVLR